MVQNDIEAVKVVLSVFIIAKEQFASFVCKKKTMMKYFYDYCRNACFLHT